jgi:hypothetical protein
VVAFSTTLPPVQNAVLPAAVMVTVLVTAVPAHWQFAL